MLLRRRQFALLPEIVGKRLWSDHVSLGLRCDLSKAAGPPASLTSLRIRPVRPRDEPLFTSGSEGREAADAAFLFESDLRTCYVAETATGTVCYMQYLIESSQNGELRRLFGDLYPPLANDEVLLEGALTLPKFRGRGIALFAIPSLLSRAHAAGANSALLYASVDNTPMLKASKRCGFVPFVLRRERFRLFVHRLAVVPLPEGQPYPFDGVGGASPLRLSGEDAARAPDAG